jgi:hypothetical protein
MFLLIPHQTALPVCCTVEALLQTLRAAVCTLESSNAREKKISKGAAAAGFFGLFPRQPVTCGRQ